jgi:hypothetical protein
MRIVAKQGQRDYYDTVQGMGGYAQDDILYVRRPRTIPLPSGLFPYPRDIRIAGARSELHFDIVGFCGKLYVRTEVVQRRYGTQGNLSWFAWTAEEVDEIIRERFTEREFEHYRTTAFLPYRKNSWGSYRQRAVHEFYIAVARPDCKGLVIFEQEKTPVFVVPGRSSLLDPAYQKHQGFFIRVDPLLNAYDFQRVVPPYEAFQQVSMFLGNMAFPNRPIPHVSDEDMAAAKGFDRFSFRKDPGKKARK